MIFVARRKGGARREERRAAALEARARIEEGTPPRAARKAAWAPVAKATSVKPVRRKKRTSTSRAGPKKRKVARPGLPKATRRSGGRKKAKR